MHHQPAIPIRSAQAPHLRARLNPYLLLPALAACAGPHYQPASPSSATGLAPAELVVEVNSVFGVQPVLEQLDGQVLHSGLQRIDMRQAIPAGRHTALVRYFNQRLIGTMTCSAAARSVDFEALAGHVYRVEARVGQEHACVTGGTQDWQPAVVDISGR